MSKPDEIRLCTEADLAERPEIIVANKMDLTDAEEGLQQLQECADKDVYGISAVTGAGIEVLRNRMFQAVNTLRQSHSG